MVDRVELSGRFVIATAEQVEEAYQRTAEQFGLLAPGERVAIWPKQQAIVWIPPHPNNTGEV